MEDAEELYRYAKDPQIGPIAGWPPHTDSNAFCSPMNGTRTEHFTKITKEQWQAIR